MKRKRKILLKKLDLWMNGIHKHMEASLKRFDSHRCLSRSEIVNVCEHMVKTASHVFTYIYSLLIEKDICDCQNVSIKLPCVCVCLLPGDLFIVSLRVSSSFSYFFVLFVLRYFPFHMIS